MPYPLNKMLGETDRHARVSNNLKLGKERQSFQANKRRNQPASCRILAKLTLSTQNIDLLNFNKKIKPRWLGPFPIIQLNYQYNNYTLELSSNSDLRHIDKTFHIGLLKLYYENHQQEFLPHHYSEPGPVKDNRYEV